MTITVSTEQFSNSKFKIKSSPQKAIVQRIHITHAGNGNAENGQVHLAAFTAEDRVMKAGAFVTTHQTS